MGTWGTAIFSDDLACDIRDHFRLMLGDGLSGPQATDWLLETYQQVLEDPQESPVFWLALAAVQQRYGRLEPRVKSQALDIIESGADLVRWQENPKLLPKRQAVLEKLRGSLLAPPRPERRIPQLFRDSCEWETGELIAYRLVDSGQWAIFRLIGTHQDLGGTSPIFEVLDWAGEQIPDREVLAAAGVRSGAGGQTQLGVGRTSQRELPRKRIQRLGIQLPPAQSVRFPHPATLWRWLDRELEALFVLR